MRWEITPLQGARFSVNLNNNNDDTTEGNPGFQFRGVRNDTSEGNATANLTSLSEASTVEGFMVECIGTNLRDGPLTITVAGEWYEVYTESTIHTPTDPPSLPLNTRVSSIQNQPSSSIVTLDWDSPSFTGGVSVSYVLTISPTPLSESSVTVEITSAEITISYNTPFNLTIRADNCAGNSEETQIVDLS